VLFIDHCAKIILIAIFRVVVFTRRERNKNSSVVQRPCDASCLSGVSFNVPTAQFFITIYCAFRFISG